MNKLARIALVFALLVACLPSARSVQNPTPPNVPGQDWLSGAAGYARAVALQRQLKVPLVIYFYIDRCPNCRRLHDHYLPTVTVQDYLQGVVKVRINPEHGVNERALAKRFGVSGYPSFFVMRHSTAEPLNVQPFRWANDLTPLQFANACRAVAPVPQKAAAVRTSGTSGKFRERPDVESKETSANSVPRITPATPATTAARKAEGKKQ